MPILLIALVVGALLCTQPDFWLLGAVVMGASIVAMVAQVW